MGELISTIQSVMELVSMISDEVSSILGLEDEVRELQNELKGMLAKLKSAEERGEEDELEEEWLKQVRSLAYEIEDVIDEYKLYQRENVIGKIRMYMSSALRGISTGIDSLKKKAIRIGKMRKQYGASHVVLNQAQARAQAQTQTQAHSLVGLESELVGIDRAKEEIIELLGLQELDNSRLSSSIAVIGMSGLGKTTVVWSVYSDGIVKDYFPIRAWVSAVSPPYNHVDVLRNMIKQFYDTADEHQQLLIPNSTCTITHQHSNGDLAEISIASTHLHSMDEISLRNLITKYLNEKRYLVVIDGVEDQGEDKGLASYIKSVLPTKNSKGSKIVLITRSENIASTWLDGSNHGLYKLERLPPPKAWQLFCNKAFRRHRGQCPSQLRDLADGIAKKCEGSPLLLSSMGVFLSTKSDDINEWRKVSNGLGYYLKHDLIGLYSTILRTYRNLPNYLKPCFLYFGLFPKGYSVKRMRLIRLWIAEGFIGGGNSEPTSLSLEEVAEEYLHQLVSSGLVEIEHSDVTGKPVMLRVNEFLRDTIILSKVNKLSFCRILPGNIFNNRDTRRLSIHKDFHCSNNNTDEHPPYEFMNDVNFAGKTNIRSLLLITDEGRCRPMPNNVEVLSFSRALISLHNYIRMLRVLDLSNAPLHEVPKEIDRLLILRYLCLRNTRVKRLPSSIGKLRDLQTLDWKHNLIRELPAELNELQKLLHLLTYCYEFDAEFSRHTQKLTGVTVPKAGVLKKFRELQKLAFLDVGNNERSRVIEELRNLTQLTRLGISGLRLSDGKDLCTAIQQMKCLQSFSLYSNEIIDINHFQPNRFPLTLNRLYLNGELRSFPSWISELHCLVKLRLRWSRLHIDPLEILSSLPNLVELQLLEAYLGDTLKIGAHGFKKLKVLHLLDMKPLKSLSICKGALPLLNLMSIGECPKLQVPQGIEYIPSLETLNFFNMPEFTINLRTDGSHHSVVKHVPNVYFQIFHQSAWRTFCL